MHTMRHTLASFTKKTAAFTITWRTASGRIVKQFKRTAQAADISDEIKRAAPQARGVYMVTVSAPGFSMTRSVPVMP
jgi:hypothetical protein